VRVDIDAARSCCITGGCMINEEIGVVASVTGTIASSRAVERPL
jgi:hypothetical protein